MDKIKLWGGVILAVLLLIVVFQNTAEVETKILFVHITMPRAVLLFITALAGFIAGMLVQRRRMKRG
jgi:uncharacterized integral membrane protein